MALAVARPETGDSTHAAPGSDNVAFQCIFVVGFVVFLAIALLAQLLTLDWRLWLPGAEGKRSLFDGVRSGVYTFMSYLT